MASTLSTVVHARLLAGLLAGDPAPGDPLPSERTLSERFGVNRHAVREAIKRLQQAGLVHVSQGGATRVLDWREHAGLDLLPVLVEAEGDSPELVRAALEMRLCIGVDAARLCAGRASAAALAELVAIAARPRGEGADPIDEDHADAYADLWRAIVIGADNVAYRLAFNSLVAGGNGERLRALSLGEAVDVEAQRSLVGAIEAGDPDRAGAIAAELLERTLAPARAVDEEPGARAAAGSPAGV